MTNSRKTVLKARNLVKYYGKVTALDHADFDLYENEILAIIGDNGAGKSSLVKALTGAVRPNSGTLYLEDRPISFANPMAARIAGIETVYQNLAISPSLDIVDNLFLGREKLSKGILGKIFRKLDRKSMASEAKEKLKELGLFTIQNISQPVETLSGGQRQGVAVARAMAFGSRVLVMDEPTSALGVKESQKVLNLIRGICSKGMSIVLISHNMPHVWEVANRIHIHRLGKRIAVINPKEFSMSDGVAIMTGAQAPPAGLYNGK